MAETDGSGHAFYRFRTDEICLSAITDFLPSLRIADPRLQKSPNPVPGWGFRRDFTVRRQRFGRISR